MDNIHENIILAFIQGDKSAFGIIFLAYHPRLLSFIEGFVKDHETARDLAQDLFFCLWRDRKKCAQVKNFKSYLFQMARHAIYNYFDHSLVNDKYVNQVLHAPITYDSTEEQFFATELQGMIELLISRMPEQRQRIYKMSREKGIKNEDIANELHISKRTVENHLSKALSEIRHIVKLIIVIFT
ncbi:MAG TPA: RNA polymerase sigma-70 factor [Prevotella sp.]|nr:RNA polymerase sigma-70 factor [Prevotella sp.]